MGWFSNFEFNSLEDLLIVELQDLYDAELRLVDALPAVIDGTNAEELREAIATDLQETRGHVTRLEEIFRQLNVEPRRVTCEAMKGLLTEARQVLEATGDPAVRDAAIIAAAQRIEHYEIAGYGAVRTWAAQMGMTGIAQLLQTTLDEEGEADKILSTIAEHSVNIHAQS
jgi:ferritin-like metal-binding protein YciE